MIFSGRKRIIILIKNKIFVNYEKWQMLARGGKNEKIGCFIFSFFDN
jgi:hypothetical protein